MNLNKTLVRQILAECDEALKAVADRHGMKVVRKSCRYSDTELPVAFKLVGTVTDDSGTEVDPEAKAFTDMAKLFGLKPEYLGRSFMSRGRSFTVTGLKPRNRKYPVMAKTADGRGFKFPADVVERALGADMKAASA